MKLTFIRHSKTKIEPEKPIVLWGLAEEGIARAQALSGQESVRQLDVMYSSLQTKAIETMLYLAKPNAIPMRTHAGLTEVTSFTNKFYVGDAYTMQIEQYYARELERIAEGETIDEAVGRFTAALTYIVGQESEAENIGIVAHGNILALFTGMHSALDPYELHRTIQQPDVAEFDWDTQQFTRMWGE